LTLSVTCNNNTPILSLQDCGFIWTLDKDEDFAQFVC